MTSRVVRDLQPGLGPRHDLDEQPFAIRVHPEVHLGRVRNHQLVLDLPAVVLGDRAAGDQCGEWGFDTMPSAVEAQIK